METAPLSLSKRGELTFHLDGEFSQKTLQLRLNGAHVLQRAQEMELDPHCSSKHKAVQEGPHELKAFSCWLRVHSTASETRLSKASSAQDSWSLDEHIKWHQKSQVDTEHGMLPKNRLELHTKAVLL